MEQNFSENTMKSSISLRYRKISTFLYLGVIVKILCINLIDIFQFQEIFSAYKINF